MTTIIHKNHAPLTAKEAKLAAQSGEALARLVKSAPLHSSKSMIEASFEAPNGDRATISLPEGTVEVISSVLQEISRGRSVQIVSTDAELTTQEAANMLNVSRPYVVKLLRQNLIPYRSVGTRRRILLNDLLSYKENETAMRLAAVDELVAESQRLGLY